MNTDLFALFVRRPVFTTVLSLLIVLFGAVAFTFLSVRETPNVQPPTVTVRTIWPGAAPALVEADVTEAIERQVNGIEGVRTVSSTSTEGQSSITVEFELERDLDEAANDVRSRVARARRDLPLDAEEPIVEKSDADASPVIFVRVDAPGKSLLEVTEVADTLVRERLQNVPGVSSVEIFGEQRYAMRIEVDPEALAIRGLVPADVERAIVAGNVDLPAGRVEGDATELTVRLAGELVTPEAFEQLVIVGGDALVRLGDVARVRLGAENERTAARSDGAATVTVAVLPQSNGNLVDISDEVQARIPRIQADLPAGYALELNYDRSLPVRAAIEEVELTLVIAFGLVVLVILAFLRSFRATLVPAAAIPVSLVGTFAFLWAAGFTLNVFTLFGLVLAIGLVVDDAIVVVENVWRRIELGEPPETAAIEGTRQVGFAVIATTLSLVAVFVPIIFAGGTSGRLFLEFGATVAVSVLLSGFVALTLTPMLCARLLKPRGGAHDGPSWLDRLLLAPLRLTIRWPVLVVVIVALSSAVVGFGAWAVPREFFPIEDRNILFIRVVGPEGASFAWTDARMRELEPELMAAVPERISLLTRVASGPGGVAASANTGQFVFPLVPPWERERSQQDIVAALRKQVAGVTAFQTIPIQFPTVGRSIGSPLQFVILNADPEAVAAALPGFLAKMAAIPGLSAVNADLKLNKPELALGVDRDKAAQLGVSERDAARALQLVAAGVEVSSFKRGSRQYPVLMQAGRADRAAPDDLGRVHVRATSGALVPLSNLITTEERTAAASRFHFDRSPSATISANLDGITLGEGIDAVRALAAAELPEGFRTALSGEAREFADASGNLAGVFLLAVVIVFLVLAAQFDSFVDPWPILLGVPLALAGAMASLWVLGMTLSFFAQIGMILLIGLVTKNGILIVEYARQLQHEDPTLGPWEAAEQSTRLRVRPIVMTAVATVFGALPIAIGFSAPSRTPLGVVVVGGMVVATGLTLVVVPVTWAALDRAAGWLRGRRVVAVAAALLAVTDADAAPFSVGDAMTAALNHPDIVGADQAAVAADAGVGTARSVWLPSVGASAEAVYGNDPRARLGAGVGSGDVLFTSARATVPIVNLRAMIATGAAAQRADGATSAAEGAKEALLAEVGLAYVELQRAVASTNAADAAVSRSRRIADRAAARVAAGVAVPVEQARAGLQLQQDELARVRARADVARAEIALAGLLDRAPPFELPPIAAWTDRLPTAGGLDAALAEPEHPALAAARSAFAAVGAERRAVRLGWVPVVAAYGQVGAFGVMSTGAPLTRTYAFGATATLPLVVGGNRIAEGRRLTAVQAQAEAEAAGVERDLVATLRLAWANLDETRAALGPAEAAVALAGEELRLSEQAWEAGRLDHSAVALSQARLAGAEAGYADAIADLDVAVIGWAAARGELRTWVGAAR